MRVSEEQRKSHNRGIVLLIGAEGVAAWVMVNAGVYIKSALLYMALMALSVYFFLIWNKF